MNSEKYIFGNVSRMLTEESNLTMQTYVCTQIYESIRDITGDSMSDYLSQLKRRTDLETKALFKLL